MNKLKTLLIILIFKNNVSLSQIENFEDFLSFSDASFEEKQESLIQQHWKIIKPLSASVEKEITTNSIYYSQKNNDLEYFLSLQLLTGEKTSVNIEKTILRIPNGEIFDNWVKEIELDGFKLNKVENENGRLFSAQEGLMIIAEIGNIDQSTIKWYYEISILKSIIKNEKFSEDNESLPISKEELDKMKLEFTSTNFNTNYKPKWKDEYYSEGYDDPDVKFSCKWSDEGFVTGILHFNGKFCSYYGKNNLAIVWSGNFEKDTKFEGLIKWFVEEPIIRGESMVQIELFIDGETQYFNTLILDM